MADLHEEQVKNISSNGAFKDGLIYGISGPNGSGKDTVGEMLAEQYGFLFVSVTELLRDEARRRGLPVERQHLSAISAEWRRERGFGVLVDHAVDAYKATNGKYKGLVMASLRNPYETDRLHELGGVMIWVDADPKVRYDRIQAGRHLRGRAGEDDKTFEQFLIEQDAEMKQSGDEATLNMGAVRDKSDITIVNNGKDVDEFKKEVAAILLKHDLAG